MRLVLRWVGFVCMLGLMRRDKKDMHRQMSLSRGAEELVWVYDRIPV